MSNINIEIPDELHKEFKILAIRQGKDLKDLLIEVMDRVIKEPTPEPKENAVKTDYGDRFKVEEKGGE